MRFAPHMLFIFAMSFCSIANAQCPSPCPVPVGSEECAMCETETIVNGRTVIEINCYSDLGECEGSGEMVPCEYCPMDPEMMMMGFSDCPQYRVELEFKICCPDGSGCICHCPLTACGPDICRLKKSLKYVMCKKAAQMCREVVWYRIKVYNPCGQLCSCSSWSKPKERCRPLLNFLRRRR